MLSELTRRYRRGQSRTSARLQATNRYIDYGVELRVVEAAEDGDVVIPGTPKVALLESHRFGGVWDTFQNAWSGDRESPNPVVWYASKEQAELAMHGRHECGDGCRIYRASTNNFGPLPDKLLVYGAMGSGKTEAQSIWALLRAFEHAGSHREGLFTAPTTERAALILTALVKRCPPDWYRWRAQDKIFHLNLNVDLRLATTTQRSAEQGSPIQGWNSSFHGGDEYQDQIQQWGNIAARGRTAPEGRYLQFCTATAKDSPQWRAARDKLRTALDVDGSNMWLIAKMLGKSNPFIFPEFWARLIEELGGENARTTRRLVYAEDVGPELATYPSWNRQLHLEPVPLLGATDVTTEILRPYGKNLTCLVGHDPGRLVDCSTILKAYRLKDSKAHVWWVVDEVKTDQTHPAEHIKTLIRRLTKKWGLFRTDYRGRPLPDSPAALVRIDPYGNNDSRTDRTVKQWFDEMGFDHATNAASSNRSGGTGRIPKDAGIKMVDRLLATGRLRVDCDDRRQACAPKLVQAFDMEERDATTGEAEVKRAHKEDLSHYGASVRYALWLIEKLPVDTDESYTIVRRKGARRAWQ